MNDVRRADLRRALEASIDATHPGALSAAVGDLTERERGRLTSAAMLILRATATDRPDPEKPAVQDVMEYISTTYGTASFAAHKGDYPSAHEWEDTVLRYALEAIRDGVDDAEGVAAAALAWRDEDDRSRYCDY